MAGWAGGIRTLPTDGMAMITDRVPKGADDLAEYRRSEAMLSFALPPADLFSEHVQLIERALKEEDKKQVQLACNAVAQAVSAGFGVAAPKVGGPRCASSGRIRTHDS